MHVAAAIRTTLIICLAIVLAQTAVAQSSKNDNDVGANRSLAPTSKSTPTIVPPVIHKGTAVMTRPDKTSKSLGISENSSMTQFVENDLYIFTPGLADIMRRYANGEVFDMDTLTMNEVRKNPQVPSVYFWAGFIRVRRLLLNPGNKKYDKEIEDLFSQCVTVSKAVETSVPYYKDGALFYSAGCQAGLGMFAAMRKDYMRARFHGIKALAAWKDVLKRRPNSAGPLLAMGIFNFYTGRLGKFSKVLLTLAGIAPGDKHLGFKQIERSANGPSPIHFFAAMFHVHINAPFRNLHAKSERLARKFVNWYPTHPDSHLILAYVLLKRGKFEQAEKAAFEVGKLLNRPPGEYQDEMWGFSAELNQLRYAYARCVDKQDDKQLAFLNKKAHEKGEAFQDAPIIAHMYLGNMFSFANQDDKALSFYEAGRDNFSCCEWTRDQMDKYARYAGKNRIPHDKTTSKKLDAWLKKHPEVKPKK